MRASVWILIAAVFSVNLAHTAPAAEKLRGAEALLMQLEDQEGDRAAPRRGRAAALRRDLEAFRVECGQLPPPRAAERWLQLADRYLAIPPVETQAEGERPEPLDFNCVLRCLPPPATWDELAGRILTRLPAGPPRTLQQWNWVYLRHCLLGDRAGWWDDLLQLEQLRGLVPPEETPAVDLALLSLCEELLRQTDDPARIIRMLDLKLEYQPGTEWGNTLPLPDLVAQLGTPRAEAFLRRVLTSTRMELEVHGGGPTLALAQRVAFAEMPRLKSAQWGLVRTLDAIPLFQAMERRFGGRAKLAIPDFAGVQAGFGVEGPVETSYTAAQVCYAFSLVAARKPALAAEMMPGLRSVLDAGTVMEWGDRVQRAGREAELLEFLRLSLARDPELPLWNAYVALALRHGRSAEAINRLQAQLARRAHTPVPTLPLRLLLVDILLANDRTDAAAAELRRMMKVKRTEHDSTVRSPFDAAIQLTRLGQALGKPDWVAEGLRFATEDVIANPPFDLRLDSLLQLLDEFGRWEEAEGLLFEAIARETAQEIASPLTASQLPDRLAELAGLYHGAGRHNDVLRLVDGATGWGVSDLRDTMLAVDFRDRCLGYLVATVLEKAGRGSEAVPILQALIRERVDYDPGYEVLVRVHGEKCLPFLDTIARENPVEKRPLLWKGQALLNVGRFEDAERYARAGIALDPTDAGQLFGRRMHGYALLADIREARGDRAEAERYRSRVRAVRLGEEAFRLDLTGLRHLAIERTREAIAAGDGIASLHADLARRLARLGRATEAEPHYRKACELAMEGLGRGSEVEWDPDDAGDWPRGVAIAEEVFRRQAADHPEKAQPHFLLAALRTAEVRHGEALRHYWKVVERDPDSLAAWIAIQVCGAWIPMPAADRETTALEILRLDPLSQTAIPEMNAFTDLRRVWTAVVKAQTAASLAPRTSIYPLAAATKALHLEAERHPERVALRQQMEETSLWRSRIFRLTRNGSAGNAPSDQVVIHHLMNVLFTTVERLRAARQPQ